MEVVGLWRYPVSVELKYSETSLCGTGQTWSL